MSEIKTLKTGHHVLRSSRAEGTESFRYVETSPEKEDAHFSEVERASVCSQPYNSQLF